MTNIDSIVWIIVLFFIVSALVALCREVICWWSKINERLKVLYEIWDQLMRMNARAGVKEKGDAEIIDVDVAEGR